MKNEKTIPLNEAPAESEQSDSRKAGARRWTASIASFLSSAVAIICPACIPAVGSLLASLGLGFAAKEQFIRPLLVALLAVNTGMLVWSARLHRRWWVVGVGVAAAGLVYAGRYFWFGELWVNQAVLWTGAAVLIGTSLVNFRLKRACGRCA